jgi:hypothetical protein
VDIHRSLLPPLSDAKYNVVPLKDRVGWKSAFAEFTSGPRFTGGDQRSSVLSRVEGV